MILSSAIPVSAAPVGTVLYRSETMLENGISVIDEVIAYPQTRSNVTSYERTRAVTNGSVTVAVISLEGRFLYDGSSVSVLSKRVTQTDTYDGWNYSQTSFSSSGGTITLSAKLTKPLNSSIPITMTLSCDANGNISYT